MVGSFSIDCKPEQSGKTFVMIQQIISDLTQPTKKEMIPLHDFKDKVSFMRNGKEKHVVGFHVVSINAI